MMIPPCSAEDEAIRERKWIFFDRASAAGAPRWDRDAAQRPRGKRRLIAHLLAHKHVQRSDLGGCGLAQAKMSRRDQRSLARSRLLQGRRSGSRRLRQGADLRERKRRKDIVGELFLFRVLFLTPATCSFSPHNTAPLLPLYLTSRASAVSPGCSQQR